MKTLFFATLLLLAGFNAWAGEAKILTECKTDTDCMVMNVGSCCGYSPQCVNRASKPDPEAVARDCTDNGLSGVCGYAEISACQCQSDVCMPLQSPNNDERPQ
jgi:hypothetical protein